MRIVANVQTIWKTTQVRPGIEIDIPDADAMRWIRLGIAQPCGVVVEPDAVDAVVVTVNPVDDEFALADVVVDVVADGYDDEATESALVVNKDSGAVAAPRRKYTRRARAIED